MPHTHGNQPLEQGEGRHDAGPSQRPEALVTLDDMKSHQQGLAGKGNEGALQQQGGLNVEANSLYANQTGGKKTETDRVETEETKRRTELAQMTSQHVDVLGNPYVHVSGPQEIASSETKSVSVTDKTTQLAANDVPTPRDLTTGRPQSTDVTADDTSRRATA